MSIWGSRRTTRSVVLGAVCSLLAATAMCEVESFHFELGTQSMSAALREYARISGEQIIFTEEVVAGVEVAPLSGEFTARAALSLLLAGTQLVTEVSPSGAIMIRHAESRQ
jgi:iron complex outermembrane receptor protein